VQPENFKFGGGATATLLHPLVLVAMLIVILLLFIRPRKYAIVPFLLLIFLTPRPQQLVVGEAHLLVVRIIVLFGFLRIGWLKFSAKTNPLVIRWTSIDTAFTLWAITRSLAFMLLYQEQAAVFNQIGFLSDALGGYFLLRYLIQDEEDVDRAIKTFATVVVILAVSMIGEKLFDRNIFGYLGGISISPEVRDGAIRAQGPFGHSILAGVYGATMLPLFFWLWKSGKSRVLGALSMAGATIMSVIAVSSTPVMAYAASILGICLWPVREKMRLIRWGIVIGLITLHLVMKAPVWFIITHVNIIGASSGYHRANLIDQLIRHFSEWWLLGAKDNANWGWDIFDLSNQFVAEGVSGGLAALVLFIALISRGFGKLGDARKAVNGDAKKEWLIWLLGASLFAHCVGFFGVSYWDQMQVAWFSLFAMISAATAAVVDYPTKEVDTAAMSLPLRYASQPPVAVTKRSLQISRKQSAIPLKYLDESAAGQRKS
jgi:hypothetical protein